MIIITKIKNFEQLNNSILSLLDKVPNNKIEGYGDKIFKTDWNLPEFFKTEYVQFFLNFINPYLLDIANNLHSESLEIDNIWFQQYHKQDTHSWHIHAKSNFTNVYFVELPDKNLTTEIFNRPKLNLKEGDLLTFPSYLYHRSPVNFSNKRKTIISFNSNLCSFKEK